MLLPLFNGLEEEGIPWSTNLIEGYDDVRMASDAAQTSVLAVGIGVSPDAVTLTYKNIMPPHYVFRLHSYSCHAESLRLLGCNAARLVKGIPFSFDSKLEVVF